MPAWASSAHFLSNSGLPGVAGADFLAQATPPSTSASAKKMSPHPNADCTFRRNMRPILHLFPAPEGLEVRRHHGLGPEGRGLLRALYPAKHEDPEREGEQGHRRPH